MGLFDFFKKNTQQNEAKLEQSLEKTKAGFFSKLTRVFTAKSSIDEEVLDELEEALLLSDVGVETTVKIVNCIRERVAKDKYGSIKELETLLQDEMVRLMMANQPVYKNEVYNVENDVVKGKKIPYVIMVVGVNGVGKTTTIGKLAYQFKAAGYKVLLGAGDTFRAAAVEQLKIWAKRVDVSIVEKGMNADPAAVAYQAVKEGYDNDYDVVIIDTAGRLQNKINLMNELAKIRRVMAKIIPEAPQEVLLVLDASSGQNAISQATEFTKATQVSALALTKLDGTAKGGVVVGISYQFNIPVKYIGIGEGMTDLQLFNPQQFVKSLFKLS